MVHSSVCWVPEDTCLALISVMTEVKRLTCLAASKSWADRKQQAANWTGGVGWQRHIRQLSSSVNLGHESSDVEP